jgi:RNA polymerase sigma-70 factor (ECF subfamily)
MGSAGNAVELPWDDVHANLRTFIGRRVRNRADADDLVQQVLLRLVAGLDSLRDTDRVYAWVYRTARNAIVDHYRSPVTRREVASGEAVEIATALPAVDAESEDEGTALRELAACLAPMLARLPAAQQTALRLTELEGRAQAEAARLEGISLSGMKSRVQRGRRQLRAALDACCAVRLDRRGGVMGYAPPADGACGCGGGG